ncbi:MAG: hypothetical protein WBA11_16935 [Rubrivirga sp.]
MRSSTTLMVSLFILSVLGCLDTQDGTPSSATSSAAADTVDALEPALTSTDSSAVLEWCLGLLDDVTSSRTADAERDALNRLGIFHYDRATQGAITYPNGLSAFDDEGDPVSFGSRWEDRTAYVRLRACGTTIEYRPIEAANLVTFMYE